MRIHVRMRIYLAFHLCTRENCVCEQFPYWRESNKNRKNGNVCCSWVLDHIVCECNANELEHRVQSQSCLDEATRFAYDARAVRSSAFTHSMNSSKSKRKIVDTTQLRYNFFSLFASMPGADNRCVTLRWVQIERCAMCLLLTSSLMFVLSGCGCRAHTHWTRSRRAKQNRKNDTANGHTHMREQQHRHGHRGNDGNVIYIVHNTFEFNQRTRCVSQSIDFLSFCHVI